MPSRYDAADVHPSMRRVLCFREFAVEERHVLRKRRAVVLGPNGHYDGLLDLPSSGPCSDYYIADARRMKDITVRSCRIN